MADRPIPFSAPMVRAVLANTKTQTRRVVKGVKHFPEWGSAVGMVGGAWRYGSPAGLGLSDRGDQWSVRLDEDHLRRMCTSEAYGWGAGAGCPYGQPGDRLRVKEAAWMWCERRPNGQTKTGREKWLYAPMREAPVHFAADHPKRPGIAVVSPETGNRWGWRLKIGRFLPRWASRITLEVTGVRVERLQDISEADAQAEGVTDQQSIVLRADGSEIRGPVAEYAVLWEQINGPGSWDANPWVWVVEFKRVTP